MKMRWISSAVLTTLVVMILPLNSDNNESNNKNTAQINKSINIKSTHIIKQGKHQKKHTVIQKTILPISNINQLPKTKDLIEQPYIPPIKLAQKVPVYTGELHDYTEYNRFEIKQDKMLKQSFINATPQKIVQLEQLVLLAKNKGLSAHKIQFAQQKISELRQLQHKLQQELK